MYVEFLSFKNHGSRECEKFAYLAANVVPVDSPRILTAAADSSYVRYISSESTLPN